MPYIQFNDLRFPLRDVDLAVGGGDDNDVRLPGGDATARAIFRVGPDGAGLVKRGNESAVVSVNGIRLGPEPTPLLHGDRLVVGGCEFRYGDDVKAADARPAPPLFRAETPRVGGPVIRPATLPSGGHLVSLVDGREYTIPMSGATIGREIGNDIVIAAAEVSRCHARIAPSKDGYVLTDLSTNGMTVDDVAVDGARRLCRGDVIRIGPEEYRFYADVAGKTPRESPMAVQLTMRG